MKMNHFMDNIIIMAALCTITLPIMCLFTRKDFINLEGYPAAEIRTVSRTPHARSCWITRFASKVNGNFSSFGLMQRT